MNFDWVQNSFQISVLSNSSNLNFINILTIGKFIFHDTDFERWLYKCDVLTFLHSGKKMIMAILSFIPNKFL